MSSQQLSWFVLVKVRVRLVATAVVVACSSTPSREPTTPAVTRERSTLQKVLDGQITCADALKLPAQRTTHASLAPGVFAYVVPNTDRDGDGYEDERDPCPDIPEDFDGFEDHDGCPECDNDGDGIPDAVTWSAKDGRWVSHDTDGERDCSWIIEDFDGDRDEDGCPEMRWPIFGETRCNDASRRRPDAVPVTEHARSWEDRDEDGTDDEVDACPELVEDRDGFEDHDGCPDCDGILDASVWMMLADGPGWSSDDDCPNQAEDLDGDRDEGCPDR